MRRRRVVDDSGINNGSEGNQRRAAQCCDLYFIIRRSGREVSPPASGPIHRRGAMRFGAGFARSGMTLTAIPIHISVQPYSLSGIDRGGANCGTTGTAACCCEWLQCRATEPLGALRFAGSPPGGSSMSLALSHWLLQAPPAEPAQEIFIAENSFSSTRLQRPRRAGSRTSIPQKRLETVQQPGSPPHCRKPCFLTLSFCSLLEIARLYWHIPVLDSIQGSIKPTHSVADGRNVI